MSEVKPSDILVRISTKMLERYQSLAVAGAGRGRAVPLPYTFTRATVRRTRGPLGVGQKFASGKVAISYPAGLVDANGNPVAAIRSDGARTQLVTDPENFGAWSISEGTPGLTSGQNDPFGGTAAYLIDDNDGASLERIYQTVTFTGDGTKDIALFVRQGTSAVNHIAVFDVTAATLRHEISITWSGSTPTLATVGGAGTRFTPENWASGWWRVAFNADGIVAANTNRLLINATDNVVASVGTLYIFGANAWNAPFPSSYQGPGESAGAGDKLTLSYNFGSTADITVLARMARPVWADASGTIGERRVWDLATAFPALYLRGASATRDWQAVIDTAGADASRSNAIQAGTEQVIVSQFKLLPTDPQVALDVGTGMSAFTAGASLVPAFGNQTLVVGGDTGLEFYGDLIDLIFARGLFSRSEMLSIP